ncbi:TRAP transporter large permease [Roseomonas sp. E05]|uniref:TRAP transporter large permease n=1 Tax=Roseomonas sp. E05 TaxID=3046310 RepID=UPI0024BB62BE|nr:TRAP transporter large permease [Roseomonas sp. E05]MDJ0389554.1 TRAP transporter large permease [Roseomonas sp. E05]
MGLAFLGTLLMGLPIVFVLGITGVAYFLATDQPHLLLVVPQRMFAGMDQFVLLAVPLFVLAGNIMDVGGLTRRLLNFANSIVGRFRGGVSLTAIWGSFLFGGVSGSAAADAAALGSVLIPDMKRQGYNVDYAAGLIGVSSVMAPLVPPSIAMIIYGALSGTSIARLLVAGLAPGFLLATCLTAYAIWIARRRGYPKFESVGLHGILAAAAEALPVLLLPVIIVGGIRGGVFTATEAAAVAAVYALLVAGLYYRALSWDYLRRALVATAVTTASIYLLVGMANIAAFIFAMESLPQTVVDGLFGITENRFLVLLLVNLALLVLGMFLDAVGVLILTVPALMGIGQALGMDPVHLGVMVVFNVLVGFTTPPVGICLFIVAGIAKRPMERVALQSLPMIGIALLVLAALALVPQLALFLPNLIVG